MATTRSSTSRKRNITRRRRFPLVTKKAQRQIRTKMATKDQTLRDLSASTGYSPPHLCWVIAGKRGVSPFLKERLTDTLKVRIALRAA